MSDFALKLHRGPDDAALSALGPAWITIDEAARRSGISEGRLRGNCPAKYLSLGRAEKRENPQTGQTSWFIREDADARFAPVRSTVDQSKSDLALQAEMANDPVQLAIATSRHEILTTLDQRIAEDRRYALPRGVNAVIDRLAGELAERGVEGVSSRTLKRWRAKWQDGHRDLVALVDERRKTATPAGKGEEFEPYFEILRGIYLDGNKPQKSVSIKAANALARKAEISSPHPKMAQRHLLTLDREQAAMVTRYRGGPSAFNNKTMPYIPRDRSKYAERKADGTIETRAMRSDEIWCADHHICDTLVEHEGRLIRPWLTAILDIRSNRIVGVYWSATAPNKHNVLLGMRDAIVRGGNVIPDNWFVDNGKDFDCWMFQGFTKQQRRRMRKDDDGYALPLNVATGGPLSMTKVKRSVDNDRDRVQGILQLLKINMIHAAPYNARSKPVERFFGIFEEGFGKLTWTYCGKNPQEKPEHLEERLRNGPAISFADYCAEAEEWIYRVHHADALTSQIDKGRSRDEVFADNRTSGRVCRPEQLDLLLPIEKVKVTRMGVTHRGYRYHAPELAEFIGHYVSIRIDPADVSSVGVHTLEMDRKIAQVQSLDLAAYGAVSAKQADEVNARVKAIGQAVKRVSERGGVAYAGVAGNRQHQLAAVRRAQREDAADPTPPPSPDSLRMVHTPLAASSNAAQPSFKQAAGGEVVIDLMAFGEEGI